MEWDRLDESPAGTEYVITCQAPVDLMGKAEARGGQHCGSPGGFREQAARQDWRGQQFLQLSGPMRPCSQASRTAACQHWDFGLLMFLKPCFMFVAPESVPTPTLGMLSPRARKKIGVNLHWLA